MSARKNQMGFEYKSLRTFPFFYRVKYPIYLCQTIIIKKLLQIYLVNVSALMLIYTIQTPFN